MSNNTTGSKYEQIIAAAEHLIAETGFSGFSMHKLALEAGVAAGTIYRYFSDKEHLLEEVRLSINLRIANAVQTNVDDTMSLKKRYRTMWLNIWRFASSNLDTLNSRVQYDSLPQKNHNNTRELEKQMFAQVNRLFDQGKAEGLFKPLANEILSGLSFEACVALARKHALGCFQLDEQSLNAAIEASWDAIIKH